MKKTVFFVLFVVLSLSFSILLSSCTTANYIVGTWVPDKNDYLLTKFEFNKDKTLAVYVVTKILQTTWTYNSSEKQWEFVFSNNYFSEEVFCVVKIKDNADDRIIFSGSGETSTLGSKTFKRAD